MSDLSYKKQDDVRLRARKANLEVRENGQLRHAKIHTSCLIKDIDNKNVLTPALRELLEASLTLQTTSTKILAAHLHRSPSTIRTEFHRILAILGGHNRHSQANHINFRFNIIGDKK